MDGQGTEPFRRAIVTAYKKSVVKRLVCGSQAPFRNGKSTSPEDFSKKSLPKKCMIPLYFPVFVSED